MSWKHPTKPDVVYCSCWSQRVEALHARRQTKTAAITDGNIEVAEHQSWLPRIFFFHIYPPLQLDWRGFVYAAQVHTLLFTPGKHIHLKKSENAEIVLTRGHLRVRGFARLLLCGNSRGEEEKWNLGWAFQSEDEQLSENRLSCARADRLLM